MANPLSKLGLSGKFNLEDMYNAFLGMEQRNQIFVLVGSSLLLILLIFMPITCASSKLDKVEKDFAKVKKSGQEIMTQINQYQSEKAELDRLQQKIKSDSGGDINTVIGAVANETGLDVDSIKPITGDKSDYFEEKGGDVRVVKATLEKAINFLYKLENHPTMPMRIKQISLKAGYGKKSDEMTLTFKVYTLSLKDKGESSE